MRAGEGMIWKEHAMLIRGVDFGIRSHVLSAIDKLQFAARLIRVRRGMARTAARGKFISWLYAAAKCKVMPP
jgi:hypothetical protein